MASLSPKETFSPQSEIALYSSERIQLITNFVPIGSSLLPQRSATNHIWSGVVPKWSAVIPQ